MNAQQIKEVLSLIRPALYALTGQQEWRLLAYSCLEVGPHWYSGWFQVYNDKEKVYYKVRLRYNEIDSLGEGYLRQFRNEEDK